MGVWHNSDKVNTICRWF